MSSTNKLATAPLQRRFNAIAGLAALPEGDRVDRTGGKFNAGLIRGVSILTRGEALGHGFWCDSVMLDQCLSFMLADERGLKCRFTHPGMCSDGLGMKLGQFLNPSRRGDQVIADLHLNTFAHKSPDGDLANYLMDRATEEPDQFGTSIVFYSDWEAEDKFLADNQQEVGKHYEFISPDPDNVDNLPHARIEELCACDCVDDPAANPNGLFHRDLSTIQAGEGLLDYVLGFSSSRPVTVSLGVDPDRARQFVMSYAARRGLSLPTQKGESMPKIFKKGKLAADPNPDQEKPAASADTNPPPEGATTCPECGCVFKPDQPAQPDKPTTQGEYAAQHKRFTDAFGTENGTKWFFEGVSFEAAQTNHFKAQLASKDEEITALKAELEEAKKRLSAIANSGAKPLDASPPPKGTEGAQGTGGFASLFNVKP